MTAAFWEQHSSGHHMIHPLHLQPVTRKQNVLLRLGKWKKAGYDKGNNSYSHPFSLQGAGTRGLRDEVESEVATAAGVFEWASC